MLNTSIPIVTWQFRLPKLQKNSIKIFIYINTNTFIPDKKYKSAYENT